jgi:hypothetical protein
MKNVYDKYVEKIIDEGVVTNEFIKEFEAIIIRLTRIRIEKC